MADLIEFLKARLDEDERDALAVLLALHQPELANVEWWHDQTGRGQGLVCPSCHPEESITWDLPVGGAGVKPDGWVESYVLAPCPTLRALVSIWHDHPDFDPSWVVTE